MLEKIKKIITTESVWKFLVVGATCTLIDFVIYMVIVDYIGPVFGKGISMGCSMVVNYFLNKYWSFAAKKTKKGRELVRYIIAQACNISVNVGINALVLRLTGVKVIAFIFATGIAMVVNYLLQRFWVFKEK